MKLCGIPAGVFSLLQVSGIDVGGALVNAPEVKAVGFTGSLGGGSALMKIASERPHSISCFN